jgi:hypothetical protein
LGRDAAEEAIELGRARRCLRIRKFAFTANNITYAVVGDMIGYWKCFPAEDGGGISRCGASGRW